MSITKEQEKRLQDWASKEIAEKFYYPILRNPDLFNLIQTELDKVIEGEENTKKAIFLSLCSIWLLDEEIPLHTLVSSESSAGKSFVCKNIVKLFPKEKVVYRSKITGEVFTYWHTNEETWDWNGKICYLEDIRQDVFDSPTFKIMCSEGSISTVVRKQKAEDLVVNGKPLLLLTTARTNPNTEILNRVQIISLDETKKQTERIVFRTARDATKKTKQELNQHIPKALALLERKAVEIPFAEAIATALKNQGYDFDDLRFRRDFSRLLTLIKCSTTLFQFQRETNKTNETLIATEEDYNLAHKCINYIQFQTFKGLTHKLRKAYDCCLALKEFTAREIHSRYPFVSQKMWYIYLDMLAERKLLRTEERTQEGVKQKVTYFIARQGSTFELPIFKELQKIITNVTLLTKDTKVTIVSKDTNNCNKCNLLHQKPQVETQENVS